MPVLGCNRQADLPHPSCDEPLRKLLTYPKKIPQSSMVLSRRAVSVLGIVFLNFTALSSFSRSLGSLATAPISKRRMVTINTTTQRRQ